MNDALRHAAINEHVAPLWTELARALDHAIARLPRSVGQVTRGVRQPSAKFLDDMTRLQPRDVIAFNGFTSPAMSPEGAFEGPILFRNMSRSARAIDHLAVAGAAEAEVLLPRGLPYRVGAITSEGDRLDMDLDELSPQD